MLEQRREVGDRAGEGTNINNIGPVLVDLAERINAEHEQAEAAFKTSLSHALKAGELLGVARLTPLSEGAVAKASPNRASSRVQQTRNRVSYPWPE